MSDADIMSLAVAREQEILRLKDERYELRAALESYVAKFGNCGGVYDKARAALAKATQ